MPKIPSTDTVALRDALLDLHRALLQAQRERYERDHGRIGTTNEFLGLVLEHKTFEWLRAMSALIARIDEWIDEPAERGDEWPALIEALRNLIQAEPRHAAFGTPYWSIVEATPEVLVGHVRLWRLLGPRPAPG